MDRLLTPKDLQSALDDQGITACLIQDIGDTPTVAAAAAALGVASERIVKTLLFLVTEPGQRDAAQGRGGAELVLGAPRDGAPRDRAPGDGAPRDVRPRPVVVISNGESRVDRKALAAAFAVGAKRVKLAPADVVMNVLGYPAGGVPPFGHRTVLPVLVDEAVVSLGDSQDGVIYAGGGDHRTMLRLTVAELLRVVRPQQILPLSH